MVVTKETKARRTLSRNVVVTNKLGRAYGFTADNARIADARTGRAFYLAAAVETSANGVVNDDAYEYETIADPFMEHLAETVTKWVWGDPGKTAEVRWSGPPRASSEGFDRRVGVVCWRIPRRRGARGRRDETFGAIYPLDYRTLPRRSLPRRVSYDCTASLARCCMKTFREMSSVKMISAPAPLPAVSPHRGVVSAGAHPPASDVACVAEGFNLANRKRACDPPWSHSTSRGVGHRRAIARAAAATAAASSARNASCSGWSRALVVRLAPRGDGLPPRGRRS